MSGSGPRSKGVRTERRIVALLKASGIGRTCATVRRVRWPVCRRYRRAASRPGSLHRSKVPRPRLSARSSRGSTDGTC